MISISFFVFFDKVHNNGSIFILFQFIFDPPLSNILNGIVSMLLAIFFIRNGVNKKWPKVN